MLGSYILYLVVVASTRRCFCNNLALRKPTIQSSTYRKFVAPNAVDGERNGAVRAGSCSHTDTGNPWWMVDLLDIYIINNVIVYNRDKYQERLDKLYVEGFLHYPLLCSNPQPQLCAYHPGPSGDLVNLTCPAGLKARYIRLRILEVVTLQSVTLCEVEVFGVKQTGCMTSRVEKQTGLQLSTATMDIAHSGNPSICSSLCSRRPGCHVFVYNKVNGSCRSPVGLVKQNDTVPASDWDLYSLC